LGRLRDFKMAKKPAASAAKITNLMDQIRVAIEVSKYYFVQHARNRLDQREVTESEVAYVLRNGWHEAQKDQYDDKHKTWKYAIRGKTIDSRELRVVVVFLIPDLVIITVIDLDAN
jgi:hypothetical protein